MTDCHDPQFRGYVWLRELSEQDIHRGSKSGEQSYLDLSARKVIREKSIGDTALVVQAYVIIAGDLQRANIPNWAERLSKLAKPYTHEGGWSGDFMSRDNPLWHDSVLSPTKSGAMSVTNRTSSRKYMRDSLREFIDVKETEAVQV